MNSLIELTASSNGSIDLSGVSQTIMNYVNPALTVVFTVIAVICFVALIAIAVKFFTIKDPMERQENLKRLAWWGVGLLICGIAILLVNTIIPIIFNGQQLNWVPNQGSGSGAQG